ncbi:MAG TPA: DUF2589 domain-containing protein [Bacteroidia bacterium]|nr:DUF2589 domain-containing protein [Bacteroidia bacterium]
MISFKAFIEGINSAIVAANDDLMNKHEEILDTYFEKTGEDKTDGHEGHSTLRPKSVCIQYPKMEVDGSITMIDVDVPLVTLIPIEFTKIDKVKITAQFGLQVINNDLQIIFSNEAPKKKWSLFGGSKTDDKTPSPGQLEITIRPSETPEGLKKMIDGYDKVLRAQIPH